MSINTEQMPPPRMVRLYTIGYVVPPRAATRILINLAVVKPFKVFFAILVFWATRLTNSFFGKALIAWSPLALMICSPWRLRNKKSSAGSQVWPEFIKTGATSYTPKSRKKRTTTSVIFNIEKVSRKTKVIQTY